MRTTARTALRAEADAPRRYEARAFNINTFPRAFGRELQARNFLCQGSSLEFLSNNKFDFNKAIYKGVSYLSEAEEELIRTKRCAAGRRAPFACLLILFPASITPLPQRRNGRGRLQLAVHGAHVCHATARHPPAAVGPEAAAAMD